MISEKQQRANRENAKKSTGPRTAEGKARSSKNGIKHGLLARDAVMAGEDQAEYDGPKGTVTLTLNPCRGRLVPRGFRCVAQTNHRTFKSRSPLFPTTYSTGYPCTPTSERYPESEQTPAP